MVSDPCMLEESGRLERECAHEVGMGARLRLDGGDRFGIGSIAVYVDSHSNLLLFDRGVVPPLDFNVHRLEPRALGEPEPFADLFRLETDRAACFVGGVTFSSFHLFVVRRFGGDSGAVAERDRGCVRARGAGGSPPACTPSTPPPSLLPLPGLSRRLLGRGSALRAAAPPPSLDSPSPLPPVFGLGVLPYLASIPLLPALRRFADRAGSTVEAAAGDASRDLGDVRVLLARPPLLSLFREEVRREGSTDAESPVPPSFPKARSFFDFVPPLFRPRFLEGRWGAAAGSMGGSPAAAAVPAATADARLVARGERGFR